MSLLRFGGGSEPGEKKLPIDYHAIFAEEATAVKAMPEYASHNFMPGSQPVELMHDRANKRAVKQALDLALNSQSGLEVSDDLKDKLVFAYTSAVNNYDVETRFPLSSLSGEVTAPQGTDVLQALKQALDQIPSLIGQDSFSAMEITIQGDTLQIRHKQPEWKKTQE